MNFRIASLNAENLILPGIHYYDRFDLSAAEYDEKANWIASVLDRSRAGVVGFQEVWLEDALKDVVKRSTNFPNSAHICVPGGTAAENVRGRVATRPRLGLVSQFPVKFVQTFANFPASVDLTIPFRIDGGKIVPVQIGIGQFQRPVLKAVVDVQGTDIVVFVVHLKSKGPMIAEGEDGDDPYVASLGQARATMVRAAEAVALRHLILTELHETHAPGIVLGDLNDTPDAASTQIVSGPAPHQGLEHAERQALWDVVLYSTYRIAAKRSASVHTHIFGGQRDILDQILVSEEFYQHNPRRLGQVVEHEVINDHLRDRVDEARPAGASDHGVPVAEIQLLAGHDRAANEEDGT